MSPRAIRARRPIRFVPSAPRFPAEWRLRLQLSWLPRCFAALPWPLAFRLIKLVARLRFLYRENVEPATQAAANAGFAPDRARFAYEQRVYRLVDHTDLYLSRKLGPAYVARFVDRVGAWPDGSKPFLAVTCHWGAGMFALWTLAEAGRATACLAAPLNEDSVKGSPTLLAYGRARLGEVVRICGAPIVSTGEGLRPLLGAIDGGINLLALVDVPTDAIGGGMRVTMLDRTAMLPSGLAKFARRFEVPVVFFTCELDFATGRRLVRIADAFMVGDDLGMQRIADGIDAAIRRQPAAWSFWQIAPAFFVADAANAG